MLLAVTVLQPSCSILQNLSQWCTLDDKFGVLLSSLHYRLTGLLYSNILCKLMAHAILILEHLRTPLSRIPFSRHTQNCPVRNQKVLNRIINLALGSSFLLQFVPVSQKPDTIPTAVLKTSCLHDTTPLNTALYNHLRM